ncbi:MAG: efflux RND transporter periplasmic adaptor subunit [Planctomycetes bacterium]|nr:efflux RND transporter periplasmic adaptor subunit [Planctomycetota bacterium]
MKILVRILVVIVVLAIGGAVSAKPIAEWWRKRNMPDWRTAEVEKGRIIAVVNATGTIKPQISVSVGSFVSGPVIELHGNHNQPVRQGDLLAKIDPRLYRSNVERDEATLLTRQADVKRVKAQLQQAENDERRAIALRQEDELFIAQAEMDKFHFTRLSFEAQLEVAQAAVAQAQAALENSVANLNYADIVSPVDGIIIKRVIEPGQTLAAAFQTPELFIIGQDMRGEMHVHASVDEADVGLINKAKEENRPVFFTVDAYPDDLFEGRIREIRLSHTTTQNVVTYPVIIAAPNPDLRLWPGMTATISFHISDRPELTKIPNAALRFFPDPKHVHESDRKLLETREDIKREQEDAGEANLSAEERAELRRKRNRRHVWVSDGDWLRAVEVETGISDSHFTELVSGDLPTGKTLVTGIKPKKPPGS